MEVQELGEQASSVVDQLWMRHNESVGVGGKQNGRMDEDDLGPETDVDSADDVLLSPSIAAAKAIQAQTATASPTGEEVKNYVGDNDIDSGEDSEEEWNYIPGKENNKENENPVQQIQKELNAEKEEEEEEDMESQLNPNAAEFVPVFIPPGSANSVLEQAVSSSPAKGAEQSLENINVPTIDEFCSGLSKMASELDSLKLDVNESLLETTMNGVDMTGISTKAVYGGDDSINFLSSVNSSTVANLGDDEDEAVPLNDTNPFSPSHVSNETGTIPVRSTDLTQEEQICKDQDAIQGEMFEDHFRLNVKNLDPMTQSVNMMEDEGQHEDETSPDIDFMSSGKPDLLSPEANQVQIEGNEALEAQTSSSGFDSESGPDDGDHIPTEQCNLAATAAAVGISFGEDIDLGDIVNAKSMTLIDDLHPIEKIEQKISPSVSPLPQLNATEVKEECLAEVINDIEKSAEPKADILMHITDEEPRIPVSEIEESKDQTVASNFWEENVQEIELKGQTTQQIIDLVQELKFNQEPTTVINKNKEEEPESDSGFEIINASEASNEPDLIENETANKFQQKVEETLLVNGLVSNCVPDLLLQPSESELDRQPSPVGVGTENIVADIEGAMLDSSPPMEQTFVDDNFTKVTDKMQPLEVVLTKNDEIEFEEKQGETEYIQSFTENVLNEIGEIKKALFSDDESNKISETSVPLDEHNPILEGIVCSNENIEEAKDILSNVCTELNELEEMRSSSLNTNDSEIQRADSPRKEEIINETLFNTVEEVNTVLKGDICKEFDDYLLKENEKEESVVETIVSEKKAEIELIEKSLLDEDVKKENLNDNILLSDESKQEIKMQFIIEPVIKAETSVVSEIKEIIKNEGTLLVEIENKELELSDVPLAVGDEGKTTKYEEMLSSQPTPPTTPAPGVTEDVNKQELIAAAIAAAGVAAGAGAAVVAASATKTGEKAAVSVAKKPAVGSTLASKKTEHPKAPSAKATSSTTKSPLKPGAPTSAAPKKATSASGSVAKTMSKPASSPKPTPIAASSKPSTPTSKVASSSRPSSAKPSTPTTKTSTSAKDIKIPAKPRTPTSTKPLTASVPKAPAASGTITKTMKTTSSITATKPSSATAPKKTESTMIKKTATTTTGAAKSTSSAPRAAAPTAKTTTAATALKTTTKSTTISATKPPSTKPAVSATTKTSTSTITATKASTKTVTNTTAAAKTAATRAPPAKTTTAKSGIVNSTTAKAPITKTKPATATAIKKPSSADKNIKDATNNKLSAAKQTGGIKKVDSKTKPSETKVIEPLTQEPTVTTTNGHMENGISNEKSSPVDVTPFPQIVQALN